MASEQKSELNVATKEDLSDSESLDISYVKQPSISTKLENNNSGNKSFVISMNKVLKSDSELSSNDEEDEDSKMMELPDIPMLITESERDQNKSIRLISPKKNDKHSPKKQRKSPKKYKKYDKIEVVDCMHECTQNAMNYCDSKALNALNWTNSHYWKRFNISFSLGFFCCSIIALVLTIYNNDNNYVYKYSSICVMLAPFLIFCIILFRICIKYNLQKHKISSKEDSIELNQYYKDIELRNDLINKMNSNKHFEFNIDKNMVWSVDKGYSGFAALNTILSSIFNNSLFVKFPKKPIKISLNDIKHLIHHKIINDSYLNLRKFPKIKLNVDIIDNKQMNLKRFKTLIQKMDINNYKDKDNDNKYIRTYYIANFNKQPLFYCNKKIYGSFKRMKKFVSEHGYFSPIIGYHESEKSVYALLLDVNQDYGNYLVPIERMYQSIKYKDHNGNQGGLLRIEAHFIL